MGDLAMMRVSEGRATKDDWLCRGSILADVVFMQHLFFLFWLRWLHLTNPQGTKQGTKKGPRRGLFGELLFCGESHPRRRRYKSWVSCEGENPNSPKAVLQI